MGNIRNISRRSFVKVVGLASGGLVLACNTDIFSDKNSKNNLVLLNHEKIHIRQQLELLIVPFFIWYGIEFLIRYFQFMNWNLAYRNISFEREAYANEKDLNYLKKRSFWEFYNFL